MKKFLCYDTNDAASDKINVSPNGVLKPNSTVPSTNGASYQQLVTDGSGNTKWEDRLAYETDPVLTEIVPEQNVSFASAGGDGIMIASWPPTFNAVEGSTYIVKFDDVEYECPYTRLNGSGPLVLGNLSIVATEADDTKEPFAMLHGEAWQILSKDSASEHTISIYGWNQTIQKIDEKFLPVASDNNYGVVKKSEIVTPYVFSGFRVPHDEMVEAVIAFSEGRASIRWGVDEVIYANYDSSADTVSMRFASEPYTTCTFENQDGVYLNTIAKLSYDEVSCTKLHLYNKDINSLIYVDGTSLQDTTMTLDTEHINLGYNNEILNKKELYLYSSTSGSSKKFKITVDDSGAITATEV